MLIKVALNY